MRRRSRGHRVPRLLVLVLVLAVAFVPFGVPRWLAGAGPAVGPHADADLARLCRDHGGTPATAPDSAQPVCTVRYGGRVYRMDAITPAGFDADTARFQRLGCGEAGRQQRAQTAPGKRRRSFIYHRTTGVCEHRP